MVVIPTRCCWSAQDCYSLQEHMLLHCGDKMMNRIAILDLHHGDEAITPTTDPVSDFRNGVTPTS